MPLCLEGPPPLRNNNLWRVPSGAIFLIELTALYLTSVLVLGTIVQFFKHSIRENLILSYYSSSRNWATDVFGEIYYIVYF